MFTGIIECVGTVQSKTQKETGFEFSVQSNVELKDLKKGDSISINGACQTVTKLKQKEKTFFFYSSYKTIEITNFGSFEKNTVVNLERAVLPTSRLGGHIVSGHVDAVGEIVRSELKDSGNVKVLEVKFPEKFSKYIMERGSISVDGISLTVVSTNQNCFEILLIPETLQKTNARFWDVGQKVNLEMDILARYMENYFLKRNTWWKNFFPKFFR